MDDIRLAYDTPAGRAWYVGGSGLAGLSAYELRGRVLSHSQVLALARRRNRRGRNIPEMRCSHAGSDDAAGGIATPGEVDERYLVAPMETTVLEQED